MSWDYERWKISRFTYDDKLSHIINQSVAVQLSFISHKTYKVNLIAISQALKQYKNFFNLAVICQDYHRIKWVYPFLECWNIRSQDYSFPWWNFRSRDHSFPGTFVPWTIRSLELSFSRLFVPWNIRFVHVFSGVARIFCQGGTGLAS